MRKEEKMNKEAEITSHHITPSSRGGTDDPENIAYIVDKYHRRYHKLFSNMTPDEIIIILVECFWNGQWEHVKKAYERRNDGETPRLVEAKSTLGRNKGHRD
jgi:hypothetical protein